MLSSEIRYGPPVSGGVSYNSTRREGPRLVTAQSKLGEGAGTNFQLGDNGVLRMTYLRFGAELRYILAGPGSVPLAEAQRLSSCNCCPRGLAVATQACCTPCARLARGPAAPSSPASRAPPIPGPVP